MKWNRDIFLLLPALAILAFAFAGFTAKKIHTETAPVLLFTCTWEGREEILDSIVQEYEKIHRVKIITEYMPNNGTVKGDVITVNRRQVSQLIESGLIEPEFFTLLSFFYPLYYNTAILLNAGFNRPPKTAPEFLIQAEKITNPEAGIYAAAFALDQDNQDGIYADICSWIWASGIFPEKTENLSRDEIHRLAETLEFLLTLERKNYLYPETFMLNEDEKRKAFIDEKTAFMIGSAEDMELLRGIMGDKLGFTSIPAPAAYTGRPVFGSDSWILAIPKETKNREEALSFITFLAEKSSVLAGGWAVAENGNSIPVNDPFYYKAAELYISGELAGGVTGIKFRNAMIDLFSGKTGVEETVSMLINNEL